MNYSDVLNIFSETKLSPEQLAPLIGISNMTYRRWLKRENKDEELSTLHERGVREAIRVLRMRGLLPIESADRADPAAPFAAISQTIESLRSTRPDAAKEGEEAFLHELLKRIGSRADALTIIQKSKQVFESFQLRNPHIGADVNVLLQATQTRGAPQLLKTIACGALLYFLTPVDMIPDFNVGVGYLDDYGVLAFAAAFCQEPHRRRPRLKRKETGSTG